MRRLGELRHGSCGWSRARGRPGEEDDLLGTIKIAEGRHWNAGAETEGVDDAIIEQIGHVGALAVARLHLQTERLEDQGK